MKKVFYEKVGRRYKPVSEYDSELIDALPKGTHLIDVYPGGRLTRYNIDPAYAPMIAAGRVAGDVIADALRRASDMRPSRTVLTEGQRQAWKKLNKEFGDDVHTLTWPSARDASDEAVKAMMKEAEKLLNNPTVQKAFDRFLMIAELTKENKHE